MLQKIKQFSQKCHQFKKILSLKLVMFTVRTNIVKLSKFIKQK